MITPSFALTATERVLPRMALDFTTASLDPRVTFTRAGNTATVTNSSGYVVPINADLPRFDYDPITLVCKGLLIEESRTNVLLNSLIDGTILGTQAVDVTAAARTLSFYGTGQIALSGAASATVTGTGAYPTRTTFTFTPTAGVLTLTVTGTVQFAQLEVGAFATSFIPTEATAVTRNADVATMTGTNFSDWFNAVEGSFVSEFTSFNAINRSILIGSDGTNSNRFAFRYSSISRISFFATSGGASQASIDATNVSTLGVLYKPCASYKQDDFVYSVNGTLRGSDNSGSVPTLNKLSIGANAAASGEFLCGHIQKILYYPQKITAPEVVAFSK
jgi:hypothetical protein